LQDDAAHLLHMRLEAADLEQHNRLRGLVHLVNGVVHRGYKVLNVRPVERRDEGAPNRYQHLAGNLVGLGFPLKNLLAIVLDGVAALQ
jgi:hypothetical protein